MFLSRHSSSFKFTLCQHLLFKLTLPPSHIYMYTQIYIFSALEVIIHQKSPPVLPLVKRMLHFQEPKYPRWGFNSPNPNLIKIPIDLRLSDDRLPRLISYFSSSNISNTSGQIVFPAPSFEENARIRDSPPLYIS